MSTSYSRILAATIFTCVILASSGLATPGAARTPPYYELFGSRTAGWGSTNTSLTSPGPLLLVEVGENVTLNLTSVDGITHRWFLDYNNNSVANGGEPTSQNFGKWVHYNFTASNRTGSFVYRSDRTAGPGDDLGKMWGNITIVPAGSLEGPLSNPLVFGGLILAFVAVLVVAVLWYRRTGKPPVSPRE